MKLELQPTALTTLNVRDNLFQSPFWGRFKSRFDWAPQACRFTGASGSGTFLLLTRKLGGGYTAAYVPQGPDLPLASSAQGLFLEALSRSLRPLLAEGCVFVRYDLPWETPYGAEAGAREDPCRDPRPAPPIRELRMNFGTGDWNLRKAPTDLLPPDTVILDLHGGDERLLAGMSSTARYNVRMSQRRGVTVQNATLDELPTWYGLYEATTRRHGIQCRRFSYFQALLDEAAANTAAGTSLQLLLARVGGSATAGMILAIQGRRAVYLFGASSLRDRSRAPSHRLQWRAIELARDRGCTSYDLFGIPPSNNPSHPLHGLFRFKTGFGGTIVHRRGCWDYPYDAGLYGQYRGLELATEGFHRSSGRGHPPGG